MASRWLQEHDKCRVIGPMQEQLGTSSLSVLPKPCFHTLFAPRGNPCASKPTGWETYCLRSSAPPAAACRMQVICSHRLRKSSLFHLSQELFRPSEASETALLRRLTVRLFSLIPSLGFETKTPTFIVRVMLLLRMCSGVVRFFNMSLNLHLQS